MRNTIITKNFSVLVNGHVYIILSYIFYRCITVLIYYLNYQLIQNGVLIFYSTHPVSEVLMI